MRLHSTTPSPKNTVDIKAFESKIKPKVKVHVTYCVQCDTQLSESAVGTKSLCGRCDISGSDTVYTGPQQHHTSYITFTGRNISQLKTQSSKSDNITTFEQQKQQIIDEYRQYWMEYPDKHIIPDHILNYAAHNFVESQEIKKNAKESYVKRADHKKNIMGVFLKEACFNKGGILLSYGEISTFMQLDNKSFARGEKYVHQFKEEEDEDQIIKGNINAIFLRLGYTDEGYSVLKSVIHELVNICIEKNIGFDSALSSKVAGVTFVVINRCPDESMVKKCKISDYSALVKIRQNTINKIITALSDYHSHFKPTYKKYKLNKKKQAF